MGEDEKLLAEQNDCASDEQRLQDNGENLAGAEAQMNDEIVESAGTKKKRTIKQLAISGIILVAIVALFSLLHDSKFEKVQEEALHIAGTLTGGGDYFTISTYPDVLKDIDPITAAYLLPDMMDDALEAIQYCNAELGFSGAVYSRMLETTALMGRQREETRKYIVTWTYHPDDGLKVTYEKK